MVDLISESAYLHLISVTLSAVGALVHVLDLSLIPVE